MYYLCSFSHIFQNPLPISFQVTLASSSTEPNPVLSPLPTHISSSLHCSLSEVTVLSIPLIEL